MEGALEPRTVQDANALCRPFADPVADSARLFRSFLTALSQPGRVVSAPGPSEYPETLGSTGFGAALTLLDNDTRVYLSNAVGDAKTQANLRFHCGCPIVQDPANATFAILTLSEAAKLLPKLPFGTPDFPDASATALILVDDFSDTEGVRVSGPGIYKYKTLAMQAPSGVWSQLRVNADRYPLGFDTIFIGKGKIIGLPRSTRIDTAINAEGS